MIWRRLLISSETSIAQLHDYIQICFDWDNEHLHCFRIQGKNYGVAYLAGMSFDDMRTTCGFPASASTGGKRSATITTSSPIGACIFAWKISCRRIGSAPYRSALSQEELETMATALRQCLGAGGSREALGQIRGLREACERITAYQEFQPRRCDRRKINRKLRAIGQVVA